MVHFLLKHGADPNYLGPENNDNPLTIAIYNKNNDMIKLLLDQKINVNISNKYMQTPLHYMYTYNIKIPLSIKRRIMKKITNVNATDNQMNSILNLLTQHDNWKSYEDILHNHKLKIYLKNRSGICPIDNISASDIKSFYQLVLRSYLNQLNSNHEWIDEIDIQISLSDKNINLLKKDIMKKIIDQHISYPPIKKNHIIKLINPPETNITHFAAYTYNYICFVYYILSKYPEIKISLLSAEQYNNDKLRESYEEKVKNYRTDDPVDSIFRSIIRDYLNHSPKLINHIIIWKNSKKYFLSPYLISGLKKTTQKYPNTKFIIFKLTIISNENFNHANILIYDIRRRTIERFDPYGVVPFIDSKSIDQTLGSFFEDNLPNVRYVSALELSDGISFQVFSDESNDLNYVENDPVGFCVAWCLWYVETRIKNIDTKPSILIKKTIYQINKSEEKFKDYIRNYSNYLDNEKNQILKLAGLPKKYWYTRNPPLHLYRAYIKYIRKIYENIL